MCVMFLAAEAEAEAAPVEVEEQQHVAIPVAGTH